MKKYLYGVLFMALSCVCHAQVTDLQTSCATTSTGVAGSYNISYTIGEMVLVESYKTGNLFVTQGINQPETAKNKIQNTNSFEEAEITIYPNPTPDVLSVKINILTPGKFSLVLYNSLGQVIVKDLFTYTGFVTKKYLLTTSAAGTYILKLEYQKGVDEKDAKRGSYKVIKIQ